MRVSKGAHYRNSVEVIVCILFSALILLPIIECTADASPTITRAVYARDNTTTQIDVWAEENILSNIGIQSVLQVSGSGIPTRTMEMIPASGGMGKFFVTIQFPTPNPPDLPTSITVTNLSDSPESSVASLLVDEIYITQAYFNPVQNTVVILGGSRDLLVPPTLTTWTPTDPEAPLDPTGRLIVTDILVPRTSATIYSSYGAVDSVPMSVFVPPPLEGVTLDATPQSSPPPPPGTSVTWTASAAGGTGKYEYQIWLYNGDWSIVKDYDVPGNSYVWDTTGLADGTYYCMVYARNAHSISSVEAYAFLPYTLFTYVAPPPATGAGITSFPFSPQPEGITSVTWTATASGGSGTYEYKIWFYDGDFWFLKKEYHEPGNTWVWDTTGFSTGRYYVAVYVRSAGSRSSVEATALQRFDIQ